VIVGFGLEESGGNVLFDYETPDSEPHALVVGRINPYLVDAPDVFLENRKKPLCPVPEMRYGSKPADGGHLLLADEEKNALLTAESGALDWVKPFLSADEFINGTNRWCLWLKGINPAALKRMPEIMRRVEAVKAFRLSSKKESTVGWSRYPALFTEDRQPDSDFLLIPLHTSETRTYIPFGFFDKNSIVANSSSCVPNATVYHFGVLSSMMHMAWVRHVCGRLESRYRYSNTLVYNNFPWPEPTDGQKETISRAAQEVLDARAKFPGSTLADLYDPGTMPPELARAHAVLDKTVDKAYGRSTFASKMERVAFLFERYEALTRPLLPPTRSGRKRRGSAAPKRPSTRE
jgi:hypothetical protein